MPAVALSVTQLNTYVKSLLESDRNLKSVWLRGELSNFVRNAKSGHCYFSVKDRDASVKAVMFKWQASSLEFLPKDGIQVLLRGRVSLYEKDGQYQFCAEQMLPDGLGSLYLEFTRIKAKLESEGLFDHKKDLPSFPRTVGLCTSPTGAAIQDIFSVFRRLAPSVNLCVYPCLMQGAEAPASVVAGLEYFRKRGADLVIVARGGGSYEDLAAFNDETLARYVAAYPIPVVSAIGHETDFTILDFAADLRAATPSVAAEVAVGRVPSLTDRLGQALRSVRVLVSHRFSAEESRLRELSARVDPSPFLQEQMQRLDHLDFRLRNGADRYSERRSSQFERIAGRLSTLNPLSVLSRGFTFAEKDGVALRSSHQLTGGDRFTLNFKDGVVDCVADGKKERKL